MPLNNANARPAKVTKARPLRDESSSLIIAPPSAERPPLYLNWVAKGGSLSLLGIVAIVLFALPFLLRFSHSRAQSCGIFVSINLDPKPPLVVVGQADR